VKLNLGNMMYFPPYGGNGLSIQRVTVSSSSMQETSIWLPDSAELVGVLSDDHIISERISDLRDQLDTAGFTNCVILPTEGSFHSGDQEYSLNHTREVPQSLRLKGAFWMSAVLNSLTRDIEDKKVEGFCHHTLYDWGLWGAITLWPFYSGDSWHASPANHALSMYSALGGSTLLEVSDPPSTPLDYPEELPAPPIDNAWTAKSVMLGYGTPDTPKCVDVLATRTTGNTVFIVLSNRSGKTADTAVHISDYLQASQVTATAQVLSVQGFGNRTPALTDGLVKELETSNIGDYMEHPVVPDTVAISDGSVMLGTDGQSNTVVTCPLKPYSITLIKLVPEP
jgi:hypothetical protein